jgi:polyhydroxyalkanoate synthase
MRRRAFAGLRRFQSAERPVDSEPRRVVSRAGRATLLTRGPERPASETPPIILVPSLINPPDVLDLSAQRSLLRYLLREGHDAYLLDWGEPERAHSGDGFEACIETLLLPILAEFRRPPVFVGYCLGGTLAIGAAARLAAQGQPAAALATIAAPWDFAQYDAAFLAQISDVWSRNHAACEALGLVPMEILQTGFWSLDPKRTIAKYADFLDLDEDSAEFRGFVTVEDWANEGSPLTLAAGRDLALGCYAENMTANGQWSIGGTLVNVDKLDCPTLAIASTSDRIVPAATTPPLAERIDLSLGHVGMMIGSRAEKTLWKPLNDWISKHKG